MWNGEVGKRNMGNGGRVLPPNSSRSLSLATCKIEYARTRIVLKAKEEHDKVDPAWQIFPTTSKTTKFAYIKGQRGK